MQLRVPDFGEGAFCTWLKHAANMQIILILQVSHFVEKNGGTLVSDVLAQRPLLSFQYLETPLGGKKCPTLL